MSDAKKELDVIASEYTEPTPDRIVDQKFFNFISRYVVSRLTAENVLELGIGDQVWTPLLTEKFTHVTTVDGSEHLLKAMQKKLAANNWTPVYSLFEEYEPERRYDMVLATYVLEHVDDPLLVLQLARRRWLKEGGRIVVVVPHALSLHRRLAVETGISAYPAQLGDTDRRMGHKHCFSCFDMEALIVDAGFRVIESKGMMIKVLPNRLLTELSNDQLEGLFKLGLTLPIEYSGAIYFQAETQ